MGPRCSTCGFEKINVSRDPAVITWDCRKNPKCLESLRHQGKTCTVEGCGKKPVLVTMTTMVDADYVCEAGHKYCRPD